MECNLKLLAQVRQPGVKSLSHGAFKDMASEILVACLAWSCLQCTTIVNIVVHDLLCIRHRLKNPSPAAKMRWVAGVVCSTSEERAKMAK